MPTARQKLFSTILYMIAVYGLKHSVCACTYRPIVTLTIIYDFVANSDKYFSVQAQVVRVVA